MSEPIAYVAGFLFDRNHRYVLLIEKQKPAWQRGKLNGIGGKVEPGENALGAMYREFEEETGLILPFPSWRPVCTLSGPEVYNTEAATKSPGFVVHFFCAFAEVEVLLKAKPTTAEAPRLVPIDLLAIAPVVPNVRWLVPMALSLAWDGAPDRDRAASFQVVEVPHG